MSRLAFAALALVAACSDSPRTVAYSVKIVMIDDPSPFVSVQVGSASIGATSELDETFPNFADLLATHFRVRATTASGSAADFTLSPTPCFGACGADQVVDCGDVIPEDEQWDFSVNVGVPFLDATSARCRTPDGDVPGVQ